MKKIMERMKRVSAREMTDDGFSLLELVVAIGILLVLTVGGLIGYGAVQNNAKEAATEEAASAVMTAAMAFDANGDDPKDAERQWKATAGSGSKVDVLVTPGDECITVTATHEDDIEKKRSNCGSTGNTDGSNTGGENENENGGSEEDNEPLLPGEDSNGGDGDDGGNDGNEDGAGDNSGSDETDGKDDEQPSTEYVHRPVDVNAPAGMALECRQSITQRFLGMYNQVVEVRAVDGDWDEGVQFTTAPNTPAHDRLNVEFEYNGAEYSIDMNGDTSNPLCSATFVKMK